jgi:hypothetical protein
VKKEKGDLDLRIRVARVQADQDLVRKETENMKGSAVEKAVVLPHHPDLLALLIQEKIRKNLIAKEREQGLDQIKN